MSHSTIWKLTKLGRRRASNIYAKEASDSLISYLYQNKTASEEELVNETGKSSSEVRTILRELKGAGLAEPYGGD